MTVLSRACLLIMREKNHNRLKSKRGESSAVTISMAQETDPMVNYRSYGAVWKARHKRSNRIVAVKIIPAESDLNDLMKEITILKECKSDFVIRYYGSYYKEGDLWVRTC